MDVNNSPSQEEALTLNVKYAVHGRLFVTSFTRLRQFVPFLVF